MMMMMMMMMSPQVTVPGAKHFCLLDGQSYIPFCEFLAGYYDARLDVQCIVVCVSVLVTPVSYAKWPSRSTRVGPRNHALDSVHELHLANTTERSVLDSNAGCRHHYRG